ncbi:Oidioi.mRNA.OKI2018_I69.XSR.g15428.t1.cds [Oikopleura dioica]|uniref:Oidioi.mRNA.OKI2018_I69.XSR.g15428.t1.cds n=1 Tax=Oikopleura dioica TaxID=34765 RepID=A0ABN7SCU8_OIKDI|nr:Oidioi.mRNA.OKI2018_I69.XSR.g15428.t1.cds [Oikopleura dioica]
MSGSDETCGVKSLCPPPQLIEPDNQNADTNQNLPFELNRDILKLRVEDFDSNPPSSCGEEDDDNPEHSFDAVIAADPSWVEPSQDVVVSMVSLLDHYFSDENLVKDKFLLKHVRRNKQGYVSVKLLTSFKKLKHLSRSDWRVTAFCCKSSRNLELNHSGNKVKRREQLPHIDLPTTSIKTILAKLPTGDMMTVDEISFIFRKFGSLSTVRLIRPGKEVPLDLRNHVAKHPELGQSTCAVVEFDKTEECQNAYKTLGKIAREENTGWEYSLLGSGRNPRRQQKKQKAKERQLLGGSYGYDSAEEFGSSPFVSSRENSPEVRRKFPLNAARSGQYLTPSPLVSPYGSRSNSPMRHSSSGHPSPNFQRRSVSDNPVGNNKWAIGNRSKLGQSPLARRRQITSPNDHYAKATPPSPLVVPNLLGKNNNNDEPAQKSPWFRRRQDFLAAQNDSPLGSPQNKTNSTDWGYSSSPVESGILRNPRGPPDNTTKGFHRDNPVLGKLEMLSSQVAAAATYESSSQPNC